VREVGGLGRGPLHVPAEDTKPLQLAKPPKHHSGAISCNCWAVNFRACVPY